MQGGDGSVELYDGSGFYMKGYILEGWTTAPDGQGTFYLPGQTGFDLSTDTTLYAKWKPISYKIGFDGNGSTDGSMDDMDMIYDSSSELSENVFKRDGYSFKGWALTPDGPVVYQSGDPLLNITDNDGDVIILYAVREADPIPPVPDDPSHSSAGTILAVAAIAGTAVAGLGFGLWYRNKDGEGGL